MLGIIGAYTAVVKFDWARKRVRMTNRFRGVDIDIFRGFLNRIDCVQRRSMTFQIRSKAKNSTPSSW